MSSEERAVISEIKTLAGQLLDDGQQERQVAGAGVTLPLVDALIRHSELEAANSLLARCFVAYGDDAHLSDSILQICKTATSEPARQRELDRARFANWMRSAERRNGVERLMDLEKAMRIAEDSALREEFEVAQQAIQQTNRDELNLQAIRHEFELPNEAVDRYVEQFTEPETWQEALNLAALHPPLTGLLVDNEELIETLSVEAPLSAMLPRMKLGSDGLPRWKAETDEQREDEQLAHHELLRLQIAAPLYALGLQAIGKKYDIDRNQLEAWLAEQV